MKTTIITLEPSLVSQMVKNLSAMQETRFQSIRWEDPLEKGMATQSSILAWRFPCTEEPGELYSPWGCKEKRMSGYHFHTFELPDL